MKLLAIGLALVIASPAFAAGFTSEYTRFDSEKDCQIVGMAGEGDGDWSDLVCPGFANYPFVIRYGDGREVVTYGFATETGMQSFAPFNYAGDVVEWRVQRAGEAVLPVAAIQRWHLANVDGEWTTQILVVSKVGQPTGGGACAIGFVSANEGEAANLRAREIADARAADFECGRDVPVIEDAIAEFVPPQE